jgi:hypothetical protein
MGNTSSTFRLQDKHDKYITISKLTIDNTGSNDIRFLHDMSFIHNVGSIEQHQYLKLIGELLFIRLNIKYYPDDTYLLNFLKQYNYYDENIVEIMTKYVDIILAFDSIVRKCVCVSQFHDKLKCLEKLNPKELAKINGINVPKSLLEMPVLDHSLV